MKFDLHNHSKYSDGINTIDELIEYRNNTSVSAFALTDHDSVLGLIHIDEQYKNIIIPGIELSCKHNGESVHVIGLFKYGIVPQSLIDFSTDYIKRRKDRAIKMASKLEEIYKLKLNLEELLEGSDLRAVTRGNIIRNIVKYNNMSFDEARFYISDKSEAYIPLSNAKVIDGVKFLKDNNCFVILAHPVLLKRENLLEIIDSGFDGMEVYYPSNQEEDTLYLKKLANEHNLICSAGSDHHGDKSHSFMGTCTLSLEEFKPIADAIGYDVEEMKWK